MKIKENTINEEIKKYLGKQIIELIEKKYDYSLEKVEFEIPNKFDNGNLSTNIALKNAKIIKDSPMNIGNFIQENILLNEFVEKIEIINPGFINFYYSKSYFKELVNILQTEEFFQFPMNEEKINLEFVSANPTGALHLGHARNAVFGDSLAKILTKVGYQVQKEYYINDAGVQMQNLGKSIYTIYLKVSGETDVDEDISYKGPEIETIAENIFKEYGTSKKEEKLQFFIDYGYEFNMTEIRNILKKLNISFDYYASEKYYHDNNLVKKALDKLENKGEIYLEDGAKWLNTVKYGDDKNRVLEKSDGSHTYLTSDIAYHIDKYDRGADILIDIWGGDHHGYVNRVKAAIESLGYDKNRLEIELIQMVSILANNEKVKMSKRAGTVVTIEDLLNEFDADILRYFFIMRSPDTQLDFDIELAKKENSDNPIFYIQYAHARIEQLKKKYEQEDFGKLEIDEKQFTKEDLKILQKLFDYKNIVLEAALKRRPHYISNYLYEIAAEYHKYYNNERIFQENIAIVKNKIIISKITQIVIKDGLALLGISAKIKM